MPVSLKYSIAFVLYYFDLSTPWVMKLIYINILKVDIWPFLSVRMDSNAPTVVPDPWIQERDDDI